MNDLRFAFRQSTTAATGHGFHSEGHTIVSYGLHDEVVRGVKPALRMLLGAVCFVLLIACVNVANLLLARAEARQREMGIRGAMGASLRRLALQFVTEGLVLSLIGAALGLLLAHGGLQLVKTASVASIPRASEITLDARVFLFALGICIATGMVFGSALRRELRDLDSALPLARIRTMDQLMSAAQSRPRFLTLLLTLFSGVALILAAVGIYGVISYSVAQQTKEFGIRMALGAQRGDVLGIVLGRGMLLTVIGIAVGLGGALVLTRFLSTLLFGVTPTDPVTFLVVSILLGVVAFLASYIPARRATKVDPMMALRYE